MSEIKPLAGMTRKILGEEIPLKTPYAAYIFPTNHCNFRCCYCGHSLGIHGMKQEYDIQTGFMSMETLKRTVNQFGEFPDRLKVISLTGHGEPLLHKKLPNMIAYIKKSGVTERVEFISNGSLLNEELSDALIEAGLDCIRISLQGLTTEKYRQIGGVELDFDLFVKQICYFYEQKKQCEVFVKIMDIALDEGEDKKFYQLFESISDRMFIEQARPVYSGVEMTKEISIQADRYGRAHKSRQVCPLCFYMLGILPNGDVSPCETIYVPECLGNVYDTSLLQIWNGKKLRDFWEMQLKKQRFSHPKCRKCCAPDDVAHPEDDLDNYSAQRAARERGEI